MEKFTYTEKNSTFTIQNINKKKKKNDKKTKI